MPGLVVLLGMLLVLTACNSAMPGKSGAGELGKAGEFGKAAPLANSTVILATTTSTMDSGLLDVLIPVFEQATGYQVKPIAAGTGQALALGEKGEADVLLVHAPEAEKKLIENGTAIRRQLLMHNDFIIVGPPADPAGLRGMTDAVAGLKKLAASGQLFVSRGDDSGTHKMELALWKKAAVKPAGAAYQETGAGMGQTLNVANEKLGYTLTDRATYLAQKKNLGLIVLLEKDPALLNIYHVMEVNGEKFPKVNSAGGKAFADFLVSERGQELIRSYGIDKFGEPLFFVDVSKQETELLKGPAQPESANQQK
ncbi:tungstate transport system substrate-binding protein [Heliophilum fasciatum]|nr:substrate-binding domain-containing protein [Heliophilum fasciatum]MCW2277378.1 tungstate transport system substrate-binding protein [Heliophilum fasciatum]